jgi:transcriptional regulator with XRE-family HTH domain
MLRETVETRKRTRLREARERAGLTQRALGQAVGCDPAFVSRVENGVQKPSLAYLHAVAQVLDLWPLGTLLDEIWAPAGGPSRQESNERRRRRSPTPEEGP